MVPVNPRATTLKLLATIRVTKTYQSTRANEVVYDLLETFAPDVEFTLINPASFNNPLVDSAFPGITLGQALMDVCRFCDVQLIVLDTGKLLFRSESVEDKLKRAIRVEDRLHPTRAAKLARENNV